jgi:hypothetical protein
MVFDNLHHTATTTIRRAGVDGATVMKISRYKAMVVFKH